MKYVNAAGDQQEGAQQCPTIGYVAPDKIADGHGPEQRGILERRHQRRLGKAKGLDLQKMCAAEQGSGQGKKAQIDRGRRLPAKRRHDRAGQGYAQGGIEQGDARSLNVGDAAGQKIAAGAGQGRADGQQGDPTQGITARPQHQEDTGKAHQYRRPAAPAHTLGKDQRRHGGDEYGSDEGNGDGLCQRHQAQSRDKEKGAGDYQEGADQLQFRITGPDYMEIPAPAQHQHDDDQGRQAPGKEDLAQFKVAGNPFHHAIVHGQQQAAANHAGNAPARRLDAAQGVEATHHALNLPLISKVLDSAHGRTLASKSLGHDNP